MPVHVVAWISKEKCDCHSNGKLVIEIMQTNICRVDTFGKDGEEIQQKI